MAKLSVSEIVDLVNLSRNVSSEWRDEHASANQFDQVIKGLQEAVIQLQEHVVRIENPEGLPDGALREIREKIKAKARADAMRDRIQEVKEHNAKAEAIRAGVADARSCAKSFAAEGAPEDERDVAAEDKEDQGLI